MKQKTINILFLLLTCLSAIAANRSIPEMKRIAENVLSCPSTRTATGTELRILDSNNMLTVIGNEHIGFAIIANNDQMPSVIGYSQIPFKIIPPALGWFLDSADKAMEEILSKGSFHTPMPPSKELTDTVPPLLMTNWDQGNPYNKFCPGGNGNSSRLYPTGCVATALAQIMNYHKYPEVGKGEHQYSFQPASGDGRIISANFSETHYDWDNMLDTYSSSSAYTEEQANAVATLMLHCGVAVDMNYTASGSGAYGQEACLGLKNYFGYNKNARLYTRNYYTAELWMQMIFKELNQKRPIYYDGASEGSGGHAFVIDGYNKEGLVHVNWGWGGSANGFYDIALLNPKNYRFTNDQGMIVGICDSTVTIPYESQIVAPELSFTIYGTGTKRATISGQIYNAAAEKFTGRIACVLENRDTTIILKSQDRLTLQPIMGGRYSYTPLSLPSNNLSSLPDGTYRLYVGSRSDEDDKWQLVRPIEGNTSSYTIVINGNDITWSENQDDTWTTLPTSISSIKKQTKKNRYIYDLRGRSYDTDINTIKKGIYILEGKKIVR